MIVKNSMKKQWKIQFNIRISVSKQCNFEPEKELYDVQPGL